MLPWWISLVVAAPGVVGWVFAWLRGEQRDAEKTRAEGYRRIATSAEAANRKLEDQYKRAQSEVIRCHAELRKRDQSEAQKALENGAAGAAGFLAGSVRDGSRSDPPAAALVPDQQRPAGPGPVERRPLPH